MTREPAAAVAATPRRELRAAEAVVLALSVLAGSSLFAFAVLRFRSFKAHIHDLGLISQALWNTLQGQPFASSINPEVGYSGSYLGNHFSPGLVAWLPAYALWPSPVALLLAQAAVLAAGAWVLFRIARDRVAEPAAAALAATYLMQPALWFAGLYDFHHETAAATLSLLAWRCHERDRTTALCVTLAFMASLKEHMPLLTAAFGGYLVLFTTRRRLGAAIAVASAAYFALVMGALIPYFNDSPAHSYFERRYPHLGHGARDALVTCLTRPVDVLSVMATRAHAYYLAGLLAPWLFLPLLAPGLLLVAVPVLFVNMQSRIPISYDIGFYHSDTVLPWVALAAVAGYVRLPSLAPRLARRAGRALPVLIVFNAAWWHATVQSIFLTDLRPPLSPMAIHEDYRVTDHHRLIEHFRARIPWTASLSVQADLACFFTDRARLYPFPHRAREADFVLVDLTDPYAHRPRERRFWLEWALQATVPQFCAAVHDLLSATFSCRLVEIMDGYLLFSRSPDTMVDLARYAEAQALLARRCAEWAALPGRGYGHRAGEPSVDARSSAP
jgi:uncharacterized membrane protein